MPADEFIDFAYRGPVEDRDTEAQRPGGERKSVASVARPTDWGAYRSEVITPEGQELPAGSLCWERVQIGGEWSEWAGPTPCQTQPVPVPEPGVIGLLAVVLMIAALKRCRGGG